jgi:hypothetical protein
VNCVIIGLSEDRTTKQKRGANMNIHTLANGATLIVTSSGHRFRFNDGTECGPQEVEITQKLTCERVETFVGMVAGMRLNSTEMILPKEGINCLYELAKQADLVMVSLPCMLALRAQGIRHEFPNVVAMNATTETQRSAPADKIIDIQNWSY